MGLILHVCRPADFPDCTNGGISSRHSRLTLINAEGPFDPKPDAPAVIMESHVRGCLRIVPCDSDGKRLPGWFMFGGNFASTSDSRFSAKAEALLGAHFYGAIPIHDRQE
jgi:hypothetical protein